MKKQKKVKHGVAIKYGVTLVKLSANDLQLISDALQIVNPDSRAATLRAKQLECMFSALSEYAASVK